jgi:hypothetical protein
MRSTLDFGLPPDPPGHASHVLLTVPAGQYVCVTARDPLHTLRAAVLPDIVDRVYVAVFAGDPLFGGNWLPGGNLNGDHVIDSLDLGVHATQLGATLDPDTPCAIEGPHADINGDGTVDTLDLEFIAWHFGAQDADACCPGGPSAVMTPPITEISVRKLEQMGLGHYRRADINGDGLLNRDDLIAALAGQRPPAKPTRRRDREPR